MGWVGYFTLDSTEIINASRTETYADSAPWFKPVYKNDALRRLLLQEPYSNPTNDLAPWFDQDDEDSADFWGLYPLDVAGIEDGTGETTVVEYVTRGGTPGRLRLGTKTVVFSGALVGASTAAVEYGMRWLRRALLGAVDTMQRADQTALGVEVGYLSAPPVLPTYMPVDDPSGDIFLDGGDALGIVPNVPQSVDASLYEYQRFLRNAKVTVPPQVTRKVEFKGCGGAMWLVQFTLTAGEPYEFARTKPVIQGFLDPAVTDPWAPGITPGEANTVPTVFPEPVCGVDVWTPLYDPECGMIYSPPAPPSVPLGCYVPPATWNRYTITVPGPNVPLWGEVVPVLTVHAATEMRNLRVRFYRDPLGTFNPDDEPCSFVADWVLSYIPTGGTMVIDGSAEKVWVTTALGATRRADSLVFANDSTPIEWVALSGGEGWLLTLDLPDGEPVPVVDLALVPRAI